MKMQIDCFISEMIMIMIEHFSFQMIAIFFIFSEFLNFEKKNVERELAFSEKIMSFFLLTISAFSMKNLFLTDSSAFYFLILSVILMIQFSAFLKALFSDFSKSVSSVLFFAAGSL